MTQAATWGVPATGPSTAIQYSVRANASLDAVLSMHYGASAPTYAVQGTQWMDTTNSPQMDLRIRDQSSNNVKWGHLSGGAFFPFLTTAALDALRNSLIPVGFGPVAWWLPTDPTIQGFIYAYGQQITTTYPVLRAALIAASSPYGTAGGNPLCIDMRGRAPWGKDDQGGTAAGRLTTAGGGVNGIALGAVGGAQNRTIAQANLPSVNLSAASLTAVLDDDRIDYGAVSATLMPRNLATNQVQAVPSTPNNVNVLTGLGTGATLNGTLTIHNKNSTVGGSVPLGGSGTALITMPPAIVVYYVIKAH